MKAQYNISKWPDVQNIAARMDRLINDKLYPIKTEAMARYMDYFDNNCKRSKEIISEARQYIPGGVQHNLAFNYPFPLAIDKAEGPYLFDVDGNRYVDYLQAGGPTLLGSNYKPVTDKVIEVILEPIGPESGTRIMPFDYCAKARGLCDEFGALLIFDEVVSAFRVGPGGAAGYFNVIPDLTVFGKIVSGGFPMAGGVGGREEVMSCAAGYFAIKEIIEQDAARKAGENGDKLCTGIQALIDKYKLPFVTWNTGSIVHFEVSGVMYLSVQDSDIFKKIPERQHSIEEFGAALTANGVITLAGSRIYTSMADNSGTIAESLKAFDEVFSNIEI